MSVVVHVCFRNGIRDNSISVGKIVLFHFTNAGSMAIAVESKSAAAGEMRQEATVARRSRTNWVCYGLPCRLFVCDGVGDWYVRRVVDFFASWSKD